MVRRSPSLHANLGNFFTLKKGQAPHHNLDNPQQKGFFSGIPTRKLSVKFFLSWAKWVSFQAPHPSRKVMKLETAASGVQFFRLIYLRVDSDVRSQQHHHMISIPTKYPSPSSTTTWLAIPIVGSVQQNVAIKQEENGFRRNLFYQDHFSEQYMS